MEESERDLKSGFPVRIDLHMHSAVSDGTDTPEELLEKVIRSGVGLFSLTDHDAIKGCEIIRSRLTGEMPRFVTGVEFSCRDGEGKYHILGYGYDPETAGIRQVVETGHRYRMEKLMARLDYLKTEFGVVFPEEELDRLLSMDNPGKPHIGNLMVKYGYADTRDQAISQFINRLHIRDKYVGPAEAIRGIRASGGIPVLAHPFYGDGDQLILNGEMERRLQRLTDMGLQGLEAFYSGFSEKLRREALSLAERFGLFVTAGSDYHGENKLNVIGETGLEETRGQPEGLRRFLRDCRTLP